MESSATTKQPTLLDTLSPQPAFIAGPQSLAKRTCIICAGKGYTRFVTDDGVKIDTLCSCANQGYNKLVAKHIKTPCPVCGVHNVFCQHRPRFFSDYAELMAKFNHTAQLHFQRAVQNREKLSSRFLEYGDICSYLQSVEQHLMASQSWAEEVREKIVEFANTQAKDDLVAWVPVRKVDDKWSGFLIYPDSVYFNTWDKNTEAQSCTPEELVNTLDKARSIVIEALGYDPTEPETEACQLTTTNVPNAAT